MLIGNIVLYIFGLSWFMYILGRNLQEALALCMLPFIPGDLIKIIVTVLIGPEISNRLLRAGIEL